MVSDRADGPAVGRRVGAVQRRAQELTDVPWSDGTWLNPPPSAEHGDHLVVGCAPGSDFWRTTSYGFVHDDGHALLRPFGVGSAVEVVFVLDYDEQFDQAGILVRGDATTWVKAGVEFCDGAPQAGAVVTHGVSDWSVALVPRWAGAEVTVRVSRGHDALTVRGRVGDEPFRLMRLCPWPADVEASAGPFCCAPTRADLRVRFTRWGIGSADAELHPG